MSDRDWRRSERSTESQDSHDAAQSSQISDPDVITLVSVWCKLDTIKWQYPLQGPNDLRTISATSTLKKGHDFAVNRYVLESEEFLKSWEPSLVDNEVILKRTRLKLNSKGEPIDNERLRSVYLEVRVLSSTRIKNHPNIVDILGLAWEKEYPASGELKMWPLLITRYSIHGSLADFLGKHNKCKVEWKKSFCMDIGLGISHLHGCGVIHGDVKAENVLLYPHGDTIIAKVADFGNAMILAETKDSAQLLGGTPPWNAPEWRDPLRKEDLCLTDVYSYGLLVLRIIMHNTPILEDAPFHFIDVPFSEFQDGEDYVMVYELERFKKEDSMASFAAGNCLPFADSMGLERDRLQIFFEKTLSCDPAKRDMQFAVDFWFESPSAHNRINVSSTQLGLEERQIQAAREAFVWFGEKQNTDNAEQEELLNRFELSEGLLGLVKIISRISIIDDDSQIKANIEEAASKKIYPNFGDEKVDSIDTEEIHLDFEYLNQHDWEVKQFLFHSLIKISLNEQISFRRRAQSNLYLALCFLQGFGTQVNAKKGLEHLKVAADLEDLAAQACYPRLGLVVDENAQNTDKAEAWLIAGTRTGSIIAAEDLRRSNPDAYKEEIWRFRTKFCGVGRELFDHDRCFSLFNFDQASRWDEEIPPEARVDIALNSRGDTLIHYAAICGYEEAVRKLLNAHPSCLDALNWKHETPLFCACRSGHFKIFQLLTERGAKLDEQNNEGETCLHWLSAFDNEQIPAVAKHLVDRRKSMLWSVCERNQTCYPHINNGLVEGTPLHRAVARKRAVATKALLDAGADPLHGSGPIRHYFNNGPAKTSPLILAVMMHHTEIVQIMLDHLLDSVTDLNLSTHETMRGKNGNLDLGDLMALMRFGGAYETLRLHQTCSLLYFAVYPERAITRMLFHGPEWLQRASETIQFCRKFGVNEQAVSTAGGSILFAAVERGEVDVVEHLLEDRSLRSFADRPAYPKGIRPIHLSILNGNLRVFASLLRHGVDTLSTWKEDDGMTWNALHACGMASGHSFDFGLRLLELHPLRAFAKGSEPVFSTAVANGSFKLATLLRNHGAAQDQLTCPVGKGIRGFTTLGLALTKNLNSCLPAVQYLLEPPSASEFIVEPKGRSNALHYAIFFNGSEDDPEFEKEFGSLFTYLLGKFPAPNQINQADEYGLTALHYAIIVGNVVAVKLLLGSGADPNAMTNFLSQAVGISPLDLAMIYQSMTMAEQVQKRGESDMAKWEQNARDIVKAVKTARGLGSKEARAQACAGSSWKRKIAARLIEVDRKWFPVRKLSKWEREFWKEQRRRTKPNYVFTSARGIEL